MSLQAPTGGDPARIEAVRRALQALAPRGVVIIPAHDEQELLGATLASLARCEPLDAPGRVAVLVAANNCTDDTAAVAEAWRGRMGGHDLAVVESRYEVPNVGLVRAEAATGAIAAGCAWIAFLDADVTVQASDHLRHADALAADDPTGCFAGWCDEYGDVLAASAAGRAPPIAADGRAVLDFARRFRGRALPLHDPLFRYTDGSNSLMTARGWAEIGGMEPKPVGGDSTLGDRYVARFRRAPGFLDRSVVTSNRKPWAAGRLGGFVFYPASLPALVAVRTGASASPGPAAPAARGAIDLTTCFDEACTDLHAFLCFVARKRRPLLEARGEGLADLARRVARVAERFAAGRPASVALRVSPRGLRATHASGASRELALEWDAIEDFWDTGELPAA